MAVLRSTAPRLVHNSIFFFILKFFFLARDSLHQERHQKVQFGRFLVMLLAGLASWFSGPSALEGAAIEGRVCEGTGAAATHNCFARCKLYVAGNCLAALAGTAGGYACIGRQDEHEGAQKYRAKASKQQHLLFHIKIPSFLGSQIRKTRALK